MIWLAPTSWSWKWLGAYHQASSCDVRVTVPSTPGNAPQRHWGRPRSGEWIDRAV